MPDSIIAADPSAALADFNSRMSPRQADRFIHVDSGTVRGAIERREIAYIKIGSRYKVTPAALAAWVEEYLTTKPDPLPS